MKTHGSIIALAILGLAAFAMPAAAQTSSSPQSSAPKAMQAAKPNSAGIQMKQGAKEFHRGAKNKAADTALTAKAKKALLAQSSTRHFAAKIHVASSGGIVTLSGTVPNKAAAQDAQKTIKNISGVKMVRNELTVSQGS
ncbi:MAG: BON domain-containing protein [Candidatus Binataceae bacterium]